MFQGFGVSWFTPPDACLRCSAGELGGIVNGLQGFRPQNRGLITRLGCLRGRSKLVTETLNK